MTNLVEIKAILQDTNIEVSKLNNRHVDRNISYMKDIVDKINNK